MNTVDQLINERVENPNAIKINSVGGISGVEENQQPERQTIKISANKKKGPTRRTIEPGMTVEQVNPTDYIEKAPEAPHITLQESALSQLDAAVARKQQEYRDFVESAIESDRINRERIDAGIEDNVTSEVKYLPNSVEQADAEEVKKVVELDEDEYIEKDIEEEIYGDGEVANVRATVRNNMFEDQDDEYEEDIEEEFEDDESQEELNFVQEHPTPAIINTVEEEYIEEEYPTDPYDEYETEVTAEEPEVVGTVTEEKHDVVEDVAKSFDDQIRKEFSNRSIAVTVSNTPSVMTDAMDAKSSSDFDIDDEDFEDVTYDTDVNEEQLTDEEIRQIGVKAEANLKSEILKKVVNVGKTLDTTQFVVSNKVISIKDAIKKTDPKPERVASWPLMYANRVFKATALRGPEIALLADSDDSGSENGVGLTIPQARIMYEHDANPYKPKSLENWAKTIPFLDIDGIFAAIFKASMSGANYVPYVCPKPACQHSYLSDDLKVDDLVKFQNDDAKAKFEEIKKIPLTEENSGVYESVVSVINDRFAVGLKTPSIYTLLYEYASLNSAFASKYATAVSIMQYIDYIYVIDDETNQFRPIGWKSYVGDIGKTFKSKIATYSKILKEFDDTDFSVLIALINSITRSVAEKNSYEFELPEMKCPKCGSEIEARTIPARTLVFMRQRLVDLATTPIEK